MLNNLNNRIKRLEQLAQQRIRGTYACDHCQDGEYAAFVTYDSPRKLEPRDDHPTYDANGHCRKCGTTANNRIVVRVVGPRGNREAVSC